MLQHLTTSAVLPNGTSSRLEGWKLSTLRHMLWHGLVEIVFKPTIYDIPSAWNLPHYIYEMNRTESLVTVFSVYSSELSATRRAAQTSEHLEYILFLVKDSKNLIMKEVEDPGTISSGTLERTTQQPCAALFVVLATCTHHCSMG
jgi:hypothetical protein